MRKEIIDQTAHFAAAFIGAWLLGLLLDGMNPIAGALIGLIMALPREHAQHGFGGIFQGKGRLDLALWILGGMFGGMMFSA